MILRAKRLLHLCSPCLVGLVLLAGAVSFAQENGADGGMRVAVSDGLLSVELDEVPLDEVLRAIGEQAGSQVDLRGNLGNVRPQAFAGLPLEEGIRRLVGDGGISLVLVHAADDTGMRHLAEIRAYAVSGSSTGSPVVSHRVPQRVTRLPPPPPPPPPPR